MLRGGDGLQTRATRRPRERVRGSRGLRGEEHPSKNKANTTYEYIRAFAMITKSS